MGNGTMVFLPTEDDEQSEAALSALAQAMQVRESNPPTPPSPIILQSCAAGVFFRIKLRLSKGPEPGKNFRIPPPILNMLESSNQSERRINQLQSL